MADGGREQPINGKPVFVYGKENLTDTTGKALKVNADGELVVNLEVSDIEIGAVEIKDGTTDQRASVDSNGALKVTGGASSVNAEFMSPTDFSAAFTSATTITLSGLPFSVSDSSQVQFITAVSAAGVAATYVNGANGMSMTISSNVITMTGETTPFVTGDVYQIGINSQTKAYDASTDSQKNSVLNPEYSHTTDAESLFSTAYELTASFADVGSEISVDTYKNLTLWVTIDIGTSTDVQIRILFKHESGGTEEYREIYLGSPAANETTISLNDYEIDSDADQLFKLTIPVDGVKYVQVQAKDAANGDGQIDALYVTKS